MHGTSASTLIGATILFLAILACEVCYHKLKIILKLQIKLTLYGEHNFFSSQNLLQIIM